MTLIGILAFVALLTFVMFYRGEQVWMQAHKGVADRYIVEEKPEVTEPAVTVKRPGLVDLVARVKFWFDLGQSALGVMTFGLLLFSNLDKISARLHLSGSLLQGLAFIALAIVIVVALGFVLDRVKFQQRYNRVINQRNEAITDIHRSVSK